MSDPIQLEHLPSRLLNNGWCQLSTAIHKGEKLGAADMIGMHPRPDLLCYTGAWIYALNETAHLDEDEREQIYDDMLKQTIKHIQTAYDRRSNKTYFERVVN